MLVDAHKLKHLRLSRNWTQQQLAEQSHLSLRTVQRVEKDGIASHETVAAYCAVFEIAQGELILTAEQFTQTADDARWPNLLFVMVGFLLGCGVTAIASWLW